MALWFVRGIRRGVVTARYPRRPPPPAALTAGPPVFVPERLTSPVVERIIAACPSRALRRDGAMLRFDVGACTFCGRCALAAPDAVAPTRLFELAAVDRAHLVKLIPLPGPDA
jgi:hypothetical protein